MLDPNAVGFKSKVGLAVLTLLGLSFSVRSTAPPSIDQRNLEVIGLTLFKNEVHDAEDKLGHAATFHSPRSHFPERCYTSTGNDGTVLILEDWTGTLVGFQIVRAAPSVIGKCTRTPDVTPEISTEGGLKLGLTKAEVLRLLGLPTKKSSNTFVYHEDVQSARKGSEGLFEYIDLELKFVDSKLDSIHAVHTERD